MQILYIYYFAIRLSVHNELTLGELHVPWNSELRTCTNATRKRSYWNLSIQISSKYKVYLKVPQEQLLTILQAYMNWKMG